MNFDRSLDEISRGKCFADDNRNADNSVKFHSMFAQAPVLISHEYGDRLFHGMLTLTLCKRAK